ncbi:unnamed protein product [Ixodes pacificus]
MEHSCFGFIQVHCSICIIFTHTNIYISSHFHTSFLSCSPRRLLRRCDKKPERRKKEEGLPPFAPVARFGLVQSPFLCMCVSSLIFFTCKKSTRWLRHIIILFVFLQERDEGRYTNFK